MLPTVCPPGNSGATEIYISPKQYNHTGTQWLIKLGQWADNWQFCVEDPVATMGESQLPSYILAPGDAAV